MRGQHSSTLTLVKVGFRVCALMSTTPNTHVPFVFCTLNRNIHDSRFWARRFRKPQDRFIPISTTTSFGTGCLVVASRWPSSEALPCYQCNYNKDKEVSTLTKARLEALLIVDALPLFGMVSKTKPMAMQNLRNMQLSELERVTAWREHCTTYRLQFRFQAHTASINIQARSIKLAHYLHSLHALYKAESRGAIASCQKVKGCKEDGRETSQEASQEAG